jgi:hypothetical protein
MGDTLGAMAIAGAILLGVVVFIVVITVAAVKRGEVAMHDAERHHH